MKKAYIYLTFIVMAVLAVACSKNGSQVDPVKPEAAKEANIGFGSVSARREGEVTPDASKKRQIQVYDYYTAEGTSTPIEYIDELIQESATKGVWAYVKEGKTHSYSWKKGAHKFFGWEAVDSTGVAAPGLNYNSEDKVLTIAGENNAPVALPGTANTDYRYAAVNTVAWPKEDMYEKDAYGKTTGVKPVSLTVKHLSAALSYTVENFTGQTYTINSISVSNVVTTATPTVNYSGDKEVIEYHLGTDKGDVSLVKGEGENAVKTCVWPQKVKGSKLTVKYTLGTGAATEVTVDIPDGEWVAGNYYNFKIQIVNKGIELTFTVAPWEQVPMNLDTKDDSINMSNVTWMNTKLFVGGKLVNTLVNSAYSVYMYKDGYKLGDVKKYTEEVPETYTEDVYDTYPEDVYQVAEEIIYDTYTEDVIDPATGEVIHAKGDIKTYEETILDPDTGNPIQTEGDPIILYKKGDRILDENGEPIILHHAGDRKKYTEDVKDPETGEIIHHAGDDILLHHDGDPVLDEYGRPIVHHAGDIMYGPDGEPMYEVGQQMEGYCPAQGFFTVNYPKSGLFKIELIPAYGQTEADLDASKYEIYIYDYPTTTEGGEEVPGSFRAIDPAGEPITNNTVYFQVRAADNQDRFEHKAQINIWFTTDTEATENTEWISAYSEIRANYALVIPATS